MTAYQLLLNGGEETVPAGTAALLVNLSPVFTAIAAGAFLGEVMTRRRWAGVAIACAGACLIALAGNGGIALERGALLVLGAAVAQAVFFVAQKPLLRRYSSLELTTWAMALGALMTLPLAPGLPAAIASAPAGALIAVAFLGLGASAIGFVAWAYACARVDVSLAAATLYAVPVVAFAVAWVWLGETPRAGHGARRRDRARRRRARDAPSAPARQAEAAQHQQRLLAQRARPRQHAERDRGAVGVEERAHAEQPLLAQLGEEDDVQDDGAVRRGEALERRRGGCRAASPARWRACRR